MTRWPRWTRSRWSARPSPACSRPPRPASPTSCGRCFPAATTTPTRPKPAIDWDDATCREQLVDSRAKDGFGCLALLDGRPWPPPVREAAHLLAGVLGQDLDEGRDGVVRIARRVAPERIISIVDPDARHGHKTAAHGFDGYKAHVAADPNSEIITDTDDGAARRHGR